MHIIIDQINDLIMTIRDQHFRAVIFACWFDDQLSHRS